MLTLLSDFMREIKMWAVVKAQESMGNKEHTSPY